MSAKGFSASGGTKVSLFPFLAVLLCTMGALIVLLVVFAHQAKMQARAVKALGENPPLAQVEPIALEDAADKEHTRAVQELQIAIEDVQWRIEQMTVAKVATQKQVDEARDELAHLEDHSRRLREQLDEYGEAAKRLESGDQDDAQEQQRLKAQLAELKKDLEEAKKKLEETKEQVEKGGERYAVVPHSWQSNTRRQPIYLECRREGIVIQPAGILLTERDIEGPGGPKHPLAGAMRSVREYLTHRAMSTNESVGEPYPLMLVRPSGIRHFYTARAAMQWDGRFGYELIDEDDELVYPDRDPAMVAILRAAVDSGREYQDRLRMLAASSGLMMPTGDQYVVSRSHGGLVPVGGEMPMPGDEDDPDDIQRRRSVDEMPPAGFVGPGSGPLGLPTDRLGPGNGIGGGTGSQAGGIGLAGTMPGRGNGGIAPPGAGSMPGTSEAFGPLGQRLPGAVRADGTSPAGYPPGHAGTGPAGTGGGTNVGGNAGGVGGPGGPNAAPGSGSGGTAQGYAGAMGSAHGTPGGTPGGPAAGGGMPGDPNAGGAGGAGGGVGTGGGVPSGTGVSAMSGQPPAGAVPNEYDPYVPRRQGSNDSILLQPGAGERMSDQRSGMHNPSSDGAAGAVNGAGQTIDPVTGQPIGGVAGSSPEASRPGGSCASGSCPTSPPPNEPRTSPLRPKTRIALTARRPVGALPFARPIRLECHADRFLISSEYGVDGGRVIYIFDDIDRAVDDLITVVRERVELWGDAGQRMYWRPVLEVSVVDGGRYRFAQLNYLLGESGLRIEERTASRTATRQ